MELKQDICPHCGEMETVSGRQTGEGGVIRTDSKPMLYSLDLYHVICKKCGTVIRSYVLEPKKLT